MRRWQFLALEPASMGVPARQRMTGGPPILNRDGSNLGHYLLSLKEASVEAFDDSSRLFNSSYRTPAMSRSPSPRRSNDWSTWR